MNEKGMNFLVKVNEHNFNFSNDEIDSADVIQTGHSNFNIIHGHRSVNARLLESDAGNKRVKIEIDGEFYLIEIWDVLDQMLDKMGFNTITASQVKEIKAPMPGLVVEISVDEGKDVVAGERLLILEAMKMENSIIIHAPATIKKILVTKGQPVEKNQVLIELA
jgi:biotin carboxyl carrier protein